MALKKAYADIILNTAKEAASRVMESERKGLRYHHDLCSSKDEALRLLLRLKQMIDAKVTIFFISFLAPGVAPPFTLHESFDFIIY